MYSNTAKEEVMTPYSFNIKKQDQNFFDEGVVNEVDVLIEVTDQMILNCTELIRNISNLIDSHFNKA